MPDLLDNSGLYQLGDFLRDQAAADEEEIGKHMRRNFGLAEDADDPWSARVHPELAADPLYSMGELIAGGSVIGIVQYRALGLGVAARNCPSGKGPFDQYVREDVNRLAGERSTEGLRVHRFGSLWSHSRGYRE